jgi:hypothetical protein
MENISNIVLRGSEGVFHFSGADDELPGVLQRLIAQGVRVRSFSEAKQTIEDFYLGLAHNEVM